uniref:Uncharacterized protein n=1 Tax=Chromera velia CCMP2878 TaxID=1169474 RepID=A0A0G4IBF3_9ALVE|eukprot:Cvel_12853.t1-p1 / transcript=Cvel_12853.t1 / gene=Cvel_12853 / organism=Chromera_velia_CCMP2878 / gene_product=hypothetical protein / transcript_product=hypothetical protein / location=Cvel_scaffold857:46824-54517(-) / protein_length=1043 / sequence_SO=supercontig / SO=protein_coding / is_pseudo=false
MGDCCSALPANYFAKYSDDDDAEIRDQESRADWKKCTGDFVTGLFTIPQVADARQHLTNDGPYEDALSRNAPWLFKNQRDAEAEIHRQGLEKQKQEQAAGVFGEGNPTISVQPPAPSMNKTNPPGQGQAPRSPTGPSAASMRETFGTTFSQAQPQQRRRDTASPFSSEETRRLLILISELQLFAPLSCCLSAHAMAGLSDISRRCSAPSPAPPEFPTGAEITKKSAARDLIDRQMGALLGEGILDFDTAVKLQLQYDEIAEVVGKWKVFCVPIPYGPLVCGMITGGALELNLFVDTSSAWLQEILKFEDLESLFLLRDTRLSGRALTAAKALAVFREVYGRKAHEKLALKTCEDFAAHVRRSGPPTWTKVEVVPGPIPCVRWQLTPGLPSMSFSISFNNPSDVYKSIYAKCAASQSPHFFRLLLCLLSWARTLSETHEGGHQMPPPFSWVPDALNHFMREKEKQTEALNHVMRKKEEQKEKEKVASPSAFPFFPATISGRRGFLTGKRYADERFREDLREAMLDSREAIKVVAKKARQSFRQEVLRICAPPHPDIERCLPLDGLVSLVLEFFQWINWRIETGTAAPSSSISWAPATIQRLDSPASSSERAIPNCLWPAFQRAERILRALVREEERDRVGWDVEGEDGAKVSHAGWWRRTMIEVLFRAQPAIRFGTCVYACPFRDLLGEGQGKKETEVKIEEQDGAVAGGTRWGLQCAQVESVRDDVGSSRWDCACEFCGLRPGPSFVTVDGEERDVFGGEKEKDGLFPSFSLKSSRVRGGAGNDLWKHFGAIDFHAGLWPLCRLLRASVKTPSKGGWILCGAVNKRFGVWWYADWNGICLRSLLCLRCLCEYPSLLLPFHQCEGLPPSLKPPPPPSDECLRALRGLFLLSASASASWSSNRKSPGGMEGGNAKDVGGMRRFRRVTLECGMKGDCFAFSIPPSKCALFEIERRQKEIEGEKEKEEGDRCSSPACFAHPSACVHLGGFAVPSRASGESCGKEKAEKEQRKSIITEALRPEYENGLTGSLWKGKLVPSRLREKARG